MISLQSISVQIGQRKLLDDVSLQLAKGELVALIGPNGAGKSTLIHVMAGIRKATSGAVAINGKALHSYNSRERAKLVAFLAQQQEFAWDIEACHVILLGADSQDSAQAAMERLNLGDLANRRIKSLSGGERARVMLARVMASNTDFILADEPAAHLDVRREREAMRDLKREVARRNCGSIVILHDLNLAFEFADRVLLLSAGRLVLAAPAAEAINSPAIDRAFEQEFARVVVDGRTALFPIEASA